MVMSESEEINGSGKRQKRGPFLPVNEDNDASLLADDDDDVDYGLKQEQRKTRSSTAKSIASGGRPPTQPPSSMPLPPAGTSSRTRKRKVDLTDVASSGYGRASLPSPRATTPTEFARRRHQQQRTPTVNAASPVGAARRRSSFSPSMSRFTGSSSNDISLKDTAAALSTIPAAMTEQQQQVRLRSRSASPASSVPRRSSISSGGGNSSTYASPAAKKTKTTHGLSSAMKKPVSSALKKLTEGRRRLIGSSSPGGGSSSSKNDNNGSSNDDNIRDTADTTIDGYKDYTSYEYGVDPTPVKEARRLSSIFRSSSSPSTTRLFQQHDLAIDTADTAADADESEELRTLLLETESRISELQTLLDNATHESKELAEQLELAEIDRDKYKANFEVANEEFMSTMDKVVLGHKEEIQTIESQHLQELTNFEDRITELQTSLDDATKESEELAEQLHLVEMERDSFKSQVDALSLELHEVKSTCQVENDKLQSRMEKIETDHINEIDKIKDDHVKELSQVKTDTLEELEKLKTHHRNELEKLISSNNNVLTTIETGHKEELTKIKTDHMKELATVEEAHTTTKSLCLNHENSISTMKINIAQIGMQIQHEQEIRIKADEKACEERTERMAISAQYNTLVKERYEVENELRETIESLRHELSSKDHNIEILNSELKQCKETNTELQAKEESLQQSLSAQLSMLDASKEEECAHLRGIIATLESKLKVEADRVHDMGMTSSVKVQELEETIKNLLLEKKR
jgi:chromosome segregation ATPase